MTFQFHIENDYYDNDKVILPFLFILHICIDPSK